MQNVSELTHSRWACQIVGGSSDVVERHRPHLDGQGRNHVRLLRVRSCL